MWYLMFLALFALGFIFLFLSIRMEKAGNSYWNLIFAMLSAVIWLVLALSNLQLEFPYQYYNASSDAVELGYNVYTSPIAPYSTYIFILFFWITFFYFIAMVYDKWASHKKRGW